MFELKQHSENHKRKQLVPVHREFPLLSLSVWLASQYCVTCDWVMKRVDCEHNFLYVVSAISPFQQTQNCPVTRFIPF